MPTPKVTSKSPVFTGRLQNLKVSIELDEETPVFSKPLIRMACPILSLKNIKKARNQMDQGRKVLGEDYFPEDRRDQFIYRIKKVYRLIW
jgi:hypothetical protein